MKSCTNVNQGNVVQSLYYTAQQPCLQACSDRDSSGEQQLHAPTRQVISHLAGPAACDILCDTTKVSRFFLNFSQKSMSLKSMRPCPEMQASIVLCRRFSGTVDDCVSGLTQQELDYPQIARHDKFIGII